MELWINGQSEHIPDDVRTAYDLLSHYHLQQRIVIVEIDKHIIPKAELRETLIREGNHVEIVHFVGGG